MLNSRYLRQISLSDIGIDGQFQLKKSKVLCVGIGGLGSPVLIYLASAGVGMIGIIDMDSVNITDLHRQIIFTSSDIGKKKVSVAKLYINNLNPDVFIKDYDFMLDDNNAEEIIKSYDVIVDCTDNLKTKFLINFYAVKFNIPMVYGSVYGFEGHVSIFYSNYGACYCCLYSNIKTSYIPNCSEHGVIGAVTGIIGSIQAIETIKLILYLKLNSNIKNLISKLLIFNLKTIQFNILNLKKNINCNICSKNNYQSMYVDNINSVEESNIIYIYKSKLYDIKNLNLIDISEKNNVFNEFKNLNCNILKLPFSFCLDVVNLKKIIVNNFTYVIICEYGIKSKLLCKFLRLKGFNNIFYLMLDI